MHLPPQQSLGRAYHNMGYRQNRSSKYEYYPASPTKPIITSTGSSGFNAGYNIHVTATVDGVQSAPFLIFINTPYTMTPSTRGAFCRFGTCGDCNAAGHPGQFGYANYVAHSVADLLGYTLLPIMTNESIENFRELSTYMSSAPAQSTWPAYTWNSDYSFYDLFFYCSPTQGAIPAPALTTYSPNGTIAIFNATQKFWVGSANQFSGSCVQRGVPTYYQDHAAISPYYTPTTNRADCNQGTVLN